MGGSARFAGALVLVSAGGHVVTDRGSRVDRVRESLAAAERRLRAVRGTPVEPDYVLMVERYRARLRAEVQRERRQG
jgi:hypothetical protein